MHYFEKSIKTALYAHYMRIIVVLSALSIALFDNWPYERSCWYF